MTHLRILATASTPLKMLSVALLMGLILPVTAKAAEPPSLELLEFLGNWETSDGEWQDPLELMKELDVLEAEAKTAKVEDARDGQ